MNKLKLTSAALAALMALSFAGCGSTDDSSSDGSAAANNSTASKTAEGADAEVKDDAGADAAGFTEYPIFEDEEVGFLNVSAVYFQPVPMSGGNEKTDDFDIHLEADISALENTVGFGVGDWVPYLTVDYKVTASDGSVAAQGTFMEMSASDGPHYGANTYSVEFTIHSPEENGYLLHTDAETGPGGSFDEYFADGNLKVTYDGWEYIHQEW